MEFGIRYGDRGAEVQELQEALILNGFDLPRFGADGDYGQETLTALDAFERDRKLPPTKYGCCVHQETLDALGWDAPEDDAVPDPPKRTLRHVKVYDLRDEPWGDRIQRKFKRVGGRPVIRDPGQVTGITVHQTAAKFGVAPYQIAAAGGDRELALARRALRVACHMMAFHDGFVSWANPLDWYVHHGNGFNATELGLEMDGCFPGVIGGKTWNGKPPTPVTDALVESSCAALELMVIKGREMGMPLQYVHAHRQSSATRRSDPGEELWQRVVLDFCVPVLGLTTEPARVLKDGRPIPKEWDPAGVGAY